MSLVERTARRRARGWQWALGLAIALWVAGLFLAPAALWPIGTIICHQRPERSFFLAATQLPVCARCLGVYVGAALAVPLGLMLASPEAGRRARWIFVIAALPTAVTWALEAAGAIAFSNAARFVAALPLGLCASWLILSIVGEIDQNAPLASV